MSVLSLLYLFILNTVWQKLEEENADFFRAYYIRLKLKKQIILFNHLLEHQYHLMKYPVPPKVPLTPMQNGINTMPGNFIYRYIISFNFIFFFCLCLPAVSYSEKDGDHHPFPSGMLVLLQLGHVLFYSLFISLNCINLQKSYLFFWENETISSRSFILTLSNCIS